VSDTSNDSDNTPRRDCAARMTAFDHLPPRIRAVVNYGGSIADPQVIAFAITQQGEKAVLELLHNAHVALNLSIDCPYDHRPCARPRCARCPLG